LAGLLAERIGSLPRELERPFEVAKELGGDILTTGNGKGATFSFGDEDGADQFVRMMSRDLKVPVGEFNVRRKGSHDWAVSLPPWAFEAGA
jgi:hypothetical protein